MSALRARRLGTLALVLVGVIGAAGCTEFRKNRHLKRGDAYYAEKKYKEAMLEYRNVLRFEKENPHAIARLGLSTSPRASWDQAYAFLNKANELTPDDVEVRLRLGAILLLARKPEQGAGERGVRPHQGAEQPGRADPHGRHVGHARGAGQRHRRHRREEGEPRRPGEGGARARDALPAQAQRAQGRGGLPGGRGGCAPVGRGADQPREPPPGQGRSGAGRDRVQGGGQRRTAGPGGKAPARRLLPSAEEARRRPPRPGRDHGQESRLPAGLAAHRRDRGARTKVGRRPEGPGARLQEEPRRAHRPHDQGPDRAREEPERRGDPDLPAGREDQPPIRGRPTISWRWLTSRRPSPSRRRRSCARPSGSLPPTPRRSSSSPI